MAAAFKDHLVHEGPAVIFAALTGHALLTFNMDGHTTWPRWLPPEFPAAGSQPLSCDMLPRSQPQTQDCTSWCILPKSQQLAGLSFYPLGSCLLAWDEHPHSQLSPDGSVLVTLRVIDGSHEDSHKRKPQALRDPFGYALGFQHKRMQAPAEGHSQGHSQGRHQGSQGEAAIHSNRRNKPAGATARQNPQAHPSLMAWLPGTHIYAAAALGYMYIVDAFEDRILGMWEDVPKEPQLRMDKAKAFRYENGTPNDLRRLDTGGEDGCRGLMWSPDRASLFMWTKAGCAVISYKPPCSSVKLEPRTARLEPQLKHQKLPMQVRPHRRADFM